MANLFLEICAAVDLDPIDALDLVLRNNKNVDASDVELD